MCDTTEYVLRKLAVLVSPHNNELGTDFVCGIFDDRSDTASLRRSLKTCRGDAVAFEMTENPSICSRVLCVSSNRQNRDLAFPFDNVHGIAKCAGSGAFTVPGHQYMI